MNGIHCPGCGHRYNIFRFSYAWHLWRTHGITIPTPAGGWTQARAEEFWTAPAATIIVVVMV